MSEVSEPGAEPQTIKCVIVGSHGIGKTCLLISYTVGHYPSEYIPTVFDPYSKNIMTDEQPFTLDLWDTSGAYDWDRLRPLSYPQTDIFLVCFALNDRQSFKDLTTSDHASINGDNGWLGEIRHFVPEASFLIVGLKDDLRDNEDLLWSTISTKDINTLIHGYSNHINIPLDVLGVIEQYLKQEIDFSNHVTDKEAQSLCEKSGAYKYMACSSVEMTGMDEIFEQVCRCWMEKEDASTTLCGSGCNLL